MALGEESSREAAKKAAAQKAAARRAFAKASKTGLTPKQILSGFGGKEAQSAAKTGKATPVKRPGTLKPSPAHGINQKPSATGLSDVLKKGSPKSKPGFIEHVGKSKTRDVVNALSKDVAPQAGGTSGASRAGSALKLLGKASLIGGLIGLSTQESAQGLQRREDERRRERRKKKGSCPKDEDEDSIGRKCGRRSAESRGETTGYDPVARVGMGAVDARGRSVPIQGGPFGFRKGKDKIERDALKAEFMKLKSKKERREFLENVIKKEKAKTPQQLDGNFRMLPEFGWNPKNDRKIKVAQRLLRLNYFKTD